MIVFRNSNPIEVDESNGQIILEVDPIASEITRETEVEIFTTNGSAISTVFDDSGVGVDFSPINNSIVNIDPNDLDTLTFPIDITNDAIAEPDETFQFQIVSLEDESSNGIATVTIADNDSIEEPEAELTVEEILPGIYIDSVEQLEGNASNTNFEFRVRLSQPSEELITVDYNTSDGTGESIDIIEGSNINDIVDSADYIPLNGTLKFEPGETEKIVAVEVLTDTTILPDEAPQETFFVNLSNAVNAGIEQIYATGTILDDDLNGNINYSKLPQLQLEDRAFVEGNEGENITQEITVNLIDTDGEPLVAEENIVFNYKTVDVNAAANLDYEFISSQTITILQGQSSVTIPVTIIGDAAIEADETFLIALSDIDADLVQFVAGETELEAEIKILDEDSIADVEDPAEIKENIDLSNLRGNNVFRFFNSDTGGYLYTASETEKKFIEQNSKNFVLEQSSYASVDPAAENAEEIYRFFNSATGGYFYTASETEREAIANNLDDFILENVAFSAFEIESENTIPVYRFFEVNNGVHLYTANETEKAVIENNLPNYNFEGIAFYALPPTTEVI